MPESEIFRLCQIRHFFYTLWTDKSDPPKINPIQTMVLMHYGSEGRHLHSSLADKANTWTWKSSWTLINGFKLYADRPKVSWTSHWYNLASKCSQDGTISLPDYPRFTETPLPFVTADAVMWEWCSIYGGQVPEGLTTPLSTDLFYLCA